MESWRARELEGYNIYIYILSGWGTTSQVRTIPVPQVLGNPMPRSLEKAVHPRAPASQAGTFSQGASKARLVMPSLERGKGNGRTPFSEGRSSSLWLARPPLLPGRLARPPLLPGRLARPPLLPGRLARPLLPGLTGLGLVW